VLIVVDMQNDFMPGGSLAVPDGDQLLPIVNTLIEKAQRPVFFTQDAHPANHGSFASVNKVAPYTMGELSGDKQMMWPDHCVKGTPGYDLVDGLFMPENSIIIEKGTDPKHDSYSGFADAGGKATTLITELKRAGFVHMLEKLYICGLATDYCVKATAIDAMKMGFQAVVVYDACRSVDRVSEHDAIGDMIYAGVLLMNSRWV